MYACTILTLCTLYAAQPIQPLFESALELNKFQASIFTTAIMLPLGIAPIAYGYLLETFSAKKMLQVAVLSLGILEVAFALSDSYIVLLSLRGLQGLLIPAILTSLMSYISIRSSQETVQQAISTYVGITIIGGFLGRFLSGMLSDMFGWRFFFLLLGLGLLGMSFLLKQLRSDAKPNFVKPNKKEILKVLSRPINMRIYAAMFGVFFVFQAVLNFIPFELRAMGGGFEGTKTGFIYAGYAVGLLVSLNASKVIKLFGSESKAMFIGAVIYLIGMQGFHWQSYEAMFGVMFAFCLGMFIVHAIASGYVNAITTNHKAISNGLYISFYYAGGTLGTFIPGVIYELGGWHWFLHTLSLVAIVSAALFFSLSRGIQRGDFKN
ncbi:MAG: MFS transporter [Campylobacteraceae bacterium]|nr:MFS transporter [Campylobacteraceae bacterium]